MLRLGALIAACLVSSAPASWAQPGADDQDDAEDDYGTHGFLDRLSKGTEEVDRCAPRTDVSPEELNDRMVDHYDRGAVLYEQGDYAGAVAEFVAAYCDAPDPAMFYNIGQAFERMLSYEKAVAYFERFILESPAEAANRRRAEIRVQVLRRLEARIQVATSPPGAEITLSSSTGLTSRGRADRPEPIEVVKGTYTMRIEMAGYEPIERKVVAEIGRPYSFYFELEPKKGVVRVVASPADARVFIDDRLVGIGSYVETIPVGRYRLLVEAEGRPSAEQTIEVKAGQTRDVTINLRKPPRSGRWELVAASGLLLGSAAGTAGESLFDQESTVSSLVALGGIGIGLGGAYLGVPHDIPVGYSSYIIGSTLIGTAEGALIATLLACGDRLEEQMNDDGTTTQKNVLDCAGRDEVLSGASLALASAGGAFAALTASRFDLDAGDAALINSGALWGVTSGLLLWAGFDSEPSVFAPLTLAGLNLGTVVGATLAAREEVSRRRVALIDLAGLGGAVAGFAVGQAFDSPSERLAHSTLVGMGVGLITGAFLTRGTDDPPVTLRPGVSPTASGDGLALTVGAPW